MDCGFRELDFQWNVDSGFHAFNSGILEYLSSTLDSKALDSGYHEQNFPGFWILATERGGSAWKKILSGLFWFQNEDGAWAPGPLPKICHLRNQGDLCFIVFVFRLYLYSPLNPRSSTLSVLSVFYQ